MPQFLNDLVVIEILRHLSLRDNVFLRGVNRQFSRCAEHLFKSQTTIAFEIDLNFVDLNGKTYWEVIKVSKDSRSDNHYLSPNINDNLLCLESFLKRFQCLKRIKIRFFGSETVDEFCEWFEPLFEKTNTCVKYQIKLSANSRDRRFSNFQTLRNTFGQSLESIVFAKVFDRQSIESLISSGICGLDSLKTICFPKFRQWSDLMPQIGVNLRNLQVIKIDHFLYDSIVSGNFNNLRKLKTRYTFNISFQLIYERLQNLKTLEVHCCQTEVLTQVYRSESLKRLRITFIPRLVTQIDCSNSFLEELTIESLRTKPNFIRSLMQYFPNLRYLWIRLKITCETELNSELIECNVCLKKFLIDCFEFCRRRPLLSKLKINLKYFEISPNFTSFIYNHDNDNFFPGKYFAQINIVLESILDLYLANRQSIEFQMKCNSNSNEIWLSRVIEKLCDKYDSEIISLAIEDSLLDRISLTELPQNLLLFDLKYSNQMKTPFIAFSSLQSSSIAVCLGSEDKIHKKFSLCLEKFD